MHSSFNAGVFNWILKNFQSTQFPTLTRLMGSFSEGGNGVKNILKHFNWTKSAYLYHQFHVSQELGNSDCSRTLSAISNIVNGTLAHRHFDEQEVNYNQIKSILEDFKSKTRSEWVAFSVLTSKDPWQNENLFFFEFTEDNSIWKEIFHFWSNYNFSFDDVRECHDNSKDYAGRRRTENDWLGRIRLLQYWDIWIQGKQNALVCRTRWVFCLKISILKGNLIDLSLLDTPERNRRARKAYSALLTVTVWQPENKEYQNFSDEVRLRVFWVLEASLKDGDVLEGPLSRIDSW